MSSNSFPGLIDILHVGLQVSVEQVFAFLRESSHSGWLVFCVRHPAKYISFTVLPNAIAETNKGNINLDSNDKLQERIPI